MNKMRQFARNLVRPRREELDALRADRAASDGRISLLEGRLAALGVDHAAAVRRLARLEELLEAAGVLPRS